MEAKSWYASKTIWANIVAVAALFLSQALGVEIGESLQAEVVGAVLAAVNVGLRIITKEPLK